MFQNLQKVIGSLFLITLSCISPLSQALSINLTQTGNAKADAGFRQAADIWQSVFQDDVMVNIATGFSALGNNTIGQAGAEYVDVGYSVMKTSLISDAKSNADTVMIAGLPKENTYSKLINGTWGSESFFNGENYVQDGLDTVEMTRANVKALGLRGAHDADIDATIIFNSDINFDFDKSNGIGFDSFDFTGAAFHEIGHALGFVSGVDVLDYFSFFDGSVYSDADYSVFASPLDFTRCSDESAAKGANMDWTVGNSAKHFSADGGCSIATRVSNAWATGLYQGDGFEASHWKDNQGLGIMDPSVSLGELLNFSTLDLLAFDVIGWDLKSTAHEVPEPSSLVLLIVGLLSVSLARYRKYSPYRVS